MIITKLIEKYKTGCGRGIAKITENNLALVLNRIIDWSDSIILGDDKVEFLEPGDCFCLGPNHEKARIILALDDFESLVCVMTDSGPYALQRIWEEKILPEFQMVNESHSKVDVRSWTPKNTATDYPDPDTLVDIDISKQKYRIWRERFEKNRGNCRFPEAFLELSVVSDDTFGMEVPLYFHKYGAQTTKDNMFLDIPGFMTDLVDTVLAWMYCEVPVIQSPKPRVPEEEKEEQP